MIETLMRMLAFDVHYVRSSALQTTGQQTDLLVSIVNAVGGSIYLSGDGADYQEDDKFRLAGIRPQKNNFSHPMYPQLWGEFIPGLSVLDPLFNLGPIGTCQLLLGELTNNEPSHLCLMTEVDD